MADDFSWIVLFAGIGLGALLVYLALNKGAILTAKPRTIATNEEVWQWMDYRGRERKIVVSREVKE